MKHIARKRLLASIAAKSRGVLRAVSRRRGAWALGVAFVSALTSTTPAVHAADDAKTPAQFIGRELYDVRMPNWATILAYHQHLSETTDRVRFEELARTYQNRPIMLATVSSPENLARIDDIRRIQRKLADPRTIAPGELDALVAAGRPVLFVFAVDGGQVGAYLTQIEFIHRLATSQSKETKFWLDNTVVLFMNSADPDSVDVVQAWVEKTYGKPWQGASRPGGTFYGELGRDIDTFATRETRAMVEVMRRWQPNMTHDVHTMGSVPRYGARLFTPPFVGPIPPNIHPLLWQLQGELGMTMASRVLESGMTGVTYDMHYDTGSAMYYLHHHAPRILTEASPPRMTTPIIFKMEDLRQGGAWPDPRKPSENFPTVWPAGEWGLKQIIEYSTAALEGEVNHMALNRERYLRLKHKVVSDTMRRTSAPYGFLIPADQHDASTLREMLEMLHLGEIEIGRLNGAGKAGDVDYRAGDYLVRLDQPFGGWAKAMLEPTEHPVIRNCETCGIRPPYDVTNSAYPFGMGVKVLQINAPITVEAPLVSEFPASGGAVTGDVKAAAYLLSPNQNAAFKAVARLLKSGASVSRLRAETTIAARSWPAGSYLVTSANRAKLEPLAAEFGLEFVGVAKAPGGARARLTAPRVAVYQTHTTGRNGWPRLLLPEYELPLDFVYDQDVRRGDLRKRYDVVILPALVFQRQYKEGNAPGTYPPELVGGLGDEGMRGLAAFARAGGTIVALDDAVELVVKEFNLPVKFTSGFTLAQMDRPAPTNRINGVEFAIPGSFLRMSATDPRNPLTYGMPAEFSGMFNRAPLLEPNGPDATAFVGYPSGKLLLSGLALGEELLAGKSAAIDVRLGAGHVVLFAVRPELRMQTRGTYKLLFNAIYESAARDAS